MAIAMESFSFSIRDYAARMRSVDYDKCWPFAEERAGRSLPPMPVWRFRWWVDELRAARSDREKAREAGNYMVDPVVKSAAVDVVAGAQDEPMLQSNDAVTAGDGVVSSEERQVTRTPSSRLKQRTPKKRSILELFAVAPPVHGVDDRDCRDGGGKERREDPAMKKINLEVGADGDLMELIARKKRVNEGGRVTNDTIGAKKKLKVNSKMKKKNLKVDIRAVKKEKTCKFKKLSLNGLHKVLKNEVYEQFGKMHKKLAHNQAKPATIKTMLKRHILRLVGTSNIEFRNHEIESLLAIHANLKKRKVITSTKKRKKVDHQVDLSCEASEHLSFSGKNCTVVHGQTCMSLQLPNMQTLSKMVSEVLVASSAWEGLNERPSMTEGVQLSLNDRRAQLNLANEGFITGNFEAVKTNSEKEFNASVLSTNTSCRKRKSLAEIDLNHPVPDCIDLNCTILDELTLPPSSTYSGGQKILSPRKNVGLACDHPRINGEQTFSLRSDHVNSLCNPTGLSVSVSDKKSALILTRNQDKEHWTYCLNQGYKNLSESQTPIMDSTEDVYNDFLGLYCAPKPLVINHCSSVESKSILDTSPKLVQAWRGTCTEEDTIRLPLNSQGELIQLHPRSRFCFCEPDKISNSAFDCCQFLPSCSHFQLQSNHAATKGKFPFASLYHQDDEHFFTNQYYPSSNVVISDLNSPVFQCRENLKYQLVDSKAQFDSSDSRQLEFFCCGCKDYVARDSFDKTTKSYSERDLDLRIQLPNQPTMRLMGKNVPIGSYTKEHQVCHSRKIWTDKGTVMNCPTVKMCDKEHVLRAESENPREIPFEASPCSCMLADKLASNHIVGFGSNWKLEEWNSPSKNHGLKNDHSPSPAPCHSFSNKASGSSVHCIPERQSIDRRQQKASWESYPQYFCQHMLLNSTHFNHSQGVSYSIESAYRPHYTNQVPDQTWRGLSLQKIPHWLQNTAGQDPPFISNHPVVAYQSWTIPEYIGLPSASPYCKPVISYPSGDSSISQTYGSGAPVVYSSSTVALTKSNFTSMSSTYSKRCRKRPASEDDKIMEMVKRPNLKLQEDLSPHISVGRQQLQRNQQDNMRASQTKFCPSIQKDVSLPVLSHQKDTVAVSDGSFPSKSSQTRSGPVKLSAGAKHILKPNESLDQDNSCPIYMTVPFTQGTSTSKVAL